MSNNKFTVEVRFNSSFLLLDDNIISSYPNKNWQSKYLNIKDWVWNTKLEHENAIKGLTTKAKYYNIQVEELTELVKIIDANLDNI